LGSVRPKVKLFGEQMTKRLGGICDHLVTKQMVDMAMSLMHRYL